MALPSTPDLLKIENFICFALYSAGHAMTRVYKPLLEPLGLTYPQFLVMVALWEKDDRTVGDIGATLLLESSTLTPLLKRLEAAQLIRRTRDREDERVVRIQLTPEGRALKDKTEGLPEAVGCAIGLALPDITRLTTEIKALRDRLVDAQASESERQAS